MSNRSIVELALISALWLSLGAMPEARVSGTFRQQDEGLVPVPLPVRLLRGLLSLYWGVFKPMFFFYSEVERNFSNV